MFETTSRYYSLPTAEGALPDGRRVAYKRRRFLPRSEEMELLVEATVTQGDRLDQISAKTLGDPEYFWRICDANDAMNPFDLVGESEIGRKLRVPIPQA
jgi:hypothetical protein